MRDLRGRFQRKNPSVSDVDETVNAAATAESRTRKFVALPLHNVSIAQNQHTTSTASSSETEFDSDTDRPRKQPATRSVSRIGLYMLREDLARENGISEIPGWCSQPKIQQEHFVINSCKVFFDIKSTDNQGLLLLNQQLRQDIIESIPIVISADESPSVADCWNLYDQNGLNDLDKAEAVRILQLIETKKEMGVLVSDLPHKVGYLQGSCTLKRHMNLLVECKLALRVGVVGARFVSFHHINPWLIQSFRLTRKGREKLEPYNPANQNEEPEETYELTPPEALGVATIERRTRRRTQQITPQAAKKPKTIYMLGPELVSLIIC